MELSEFEKLQKRLGYLFGDRSILIQSLTHRSYGHEVHKDKSLAQRDNERLEFLGDSILGVVLSDILLETYPGGSEGHLSKLRAAIVNETTLAQVARRISLQRCILLGNGEERTGGREKPSILASTFEALIAAIYLDGGFYAVYPVVRFLFAPLFLQEKGFVRKHDYKTQLQELLQARHKVTPVYQLVRTLGPDHARVFEVQVILKNKCVAVASGSSKKDAEQNAARCAIESFVSNSLQDNSAELS